MEFKISKGRFFIDLTIFSLCSITAIVLRITNLPIPTKRGFFCDDTSIRYPYFGETVPELVMYISCFAAGIILIIATESVLNYYSNPLRPTISIGRLKCSNLTYLIYKYLYSFFLSIVIVFLIQWSMARYIGRLRPSFIALCKPDIDLSSRNCTSSSEYILNYSCTDSLASEFVARTSFPSGHTAISICSATFLSIYIWTRWSQTLILEKIFGGILLYVGGILIAVTRFRDNLHHSTDIIGGMILGILVGFFMVNIKHEMKAKFAYSSCSSSTSEENGKTGEQSNLLQSEPVNTGNGR